jgi:hypothetical protein
MKVSESVQRGGLSTKGTVLSTGAHSGNSLVRSQLYAASIGSFALSGSLMVVMAIGRVSREIGPVFGVPFYVPLHIFM